MSMTTGSFLEHYLTLFAWVVNNGIWNTLVSSGLFAASLAAIILSEWLDARTQGADEGNKGVLSTLRVENRLYVAYIVILFACVPFLPLDITQLKFDKTRSQECGVNVADPKQTGWGKAFDSIGNQSGKVPVWWALVHAISKGVTASATASIPCFSDIRGIAMEVDETRIPTNALVQEITAFANQCYGKARTLLVQKTPTLSTKEDSDTRWIGSKYFLEKDGYYNKIQASRPLGNWPYDESRDAAYGKYTSGPLLGAGYPYCKNWWSDADIGLRARIKNAVEPDLWVRIKKLTRWSSEQQAEEETIRQLVSPAHLYKTNDFGEILEFYDNIYANTGEHARGDMEIVTGAATAAGVTYSGMSFFPSMKALRTALPMVQAFLIMGIIICLPLIIVMSTYNLKVVMMASFGLFTLHMLTFWWELARWMDSSLLKGIYGDDAPLSYALASTNEQILMLVMAAMFLLLPGLFFATMSWAGYALGRGMDGMLGNASSNAKQAGSTGGNMVGSVVKTAATRGMSKGK